MRAVEKELRSRSVRPTSCGQPKISHNALLLSRPGATARCAAVRRHRVKLQLAVKTLASRLACKECSSERQTQRNHLFHVRLKAFSVASEECAVQTYSPASYTDTPRTMSACTATCMAAARPAELPFGMQEVQV